MNSPVEITTKYVRVADVAVKTTRVLFNKDVAISAGDTLVFNPHNPEQVIVEKPKRGAELPYWSKD